MIYEYECRGCGSKFEISATVEEKAAGIEPACPACGSKKTAQSFASINMSRLSVSRASGERRMPPCGGEGCGCCNVPR